MRAETEMWRVGGEVIFSKGAYEKVSKRLSNGSVDLAGFEEYII